MKYYIIAGEASGDLIGAHLIRALKAEDPQAVFRIWGGDRMAAEAGQPMRHIRDLAIMGFVEVLLHLRTVLGNMSFCKRDIAAWKPDVVVGIDYPGFNLKIEKWAHAHGFRTIHYISPNLWAWKRGRLKGMRRYLDRLCYILPFEQRFFAREQMTTYVGHPLLDAIRTDAEPPLPVEGDKPVIALLPGSRRQELSQSLPRMAQLAKNHPEYRFVVAGMSLIGEAFYRRLIPPGTPVEVVFDKTYSLLRSAYAAVVCSGTATLETALFDVPQVVCYRGNPISYVIARAVVGRRINYISLVNLISDSPVVVELLQNDFNTQRLEQEFARITTDNGNRDRMKRDYTAMRTLLGDGGASRRTAQTIIASLS